MLSSSSLEEDAAVGSLDQWLPKLNGQWNLLEGLLQSRFLGSNPVSESVDL